MSKQALQQRLLVTIPQRGRAKTLTTELRLRDIHAFIGVSLRVLADCAHRRREVDDSLQLQLSSFFLLVDRGVLVKVQEGKTFVLKRVPRAPGTIEPKRSTIDISGALPRINWRL